MRRRTAGPSTLAIHGDVPARAANEPVAPPIYQSSTFVRAVGSQDEILYTRYGNNPNQLRLAERLARLEGAEAAIFVASGMGATALAHLAVLNPGDHLLSSDWIYGGTRKLFTEEFTRFGIEVSFVNPEKRREWRSKLRKNTRAHLHRVADQSADARARRAVARRARGGGGDRAAGGLDLRLADQLPAAGARRRRRDPQRDQVPERPLRHHRRGRGRRRDGRGGGPQPDEGLGPGAGPARRVADRARDEDPRRARAAPQPDRHGSGDVAGAAAEGAAGALPGARVAPGPRPRGADAGRLRRDGGRRAVGRPPRRRTVPARAAAHHARAEPGRRRVARLGAALHLPRRR